MQIPCSDAKLEFKPITRKKKKKKNKGIKNFHLLQIKKQNHIPKL